MMRARGWLAVASLAFAGLSLPACTPPPEHGTPDRLSVSEVLGSDLPSAFDRAYEPRIFTFPADHGPHPSFAAEWWYFTGNLDTDRGGRLGYQLTFFRTALAPPTSRTSRESAWATDQVWMAHFAVSDFESGSYHAFDRFQRGALGLAGARAEPWNVWLDDWSLEQVGTEPFPLRLRASDALSADGGADERIAVDLVLQPDKPMVLQGDAGLSRKGSAPGNASYYYSYTRLQTAGTVRLGHRELDVVGASWLDREWSTSALEDGQVGWDWFALQLSDGTDLMYYQIRAADGSAAPTSAGTLIFADGTRVALPFGRVEIEVENSWDSPIDGSRYPAGWRLTVPDRGVDLHIVPLLADQELDVAFRYWEGAVEVTGTGAHGSAVGGRGYVELTGYADGGPPP